MNPIKHNKNSWENLERIALNCCVFWLFKTLICWSDEFSELYEKPRFLLSTISIIKKPYCKRAGTDDERSKRGKKATICINLSRIFIILCIHLLCAHCFCQRLRRNESQRWDIEWRLESKVEKLPRLTLTLHSLASALLRFSDDEDFSIVFPPKVVDVIYLN